MESWSPNKAAVDCNSSSLPFPPPSPPSSFPSLFLLPLPQCEMDPDTGEPKDEIPPQVLSHLSDLGCEVTKPSEIAQQKVAGVMKKIQAGLDEANKNAPSTAQKVGEEGSSLAAGYNPIPSP